MRWKKVSNPDVIDARGGGGGGGGFGGGRVAVPGGLGLLGVIVYVAISVLGGGGGSGGSFDVPGGFDGGTAPPAAAPIPASQDPQKDLKDFSAYVFTDVQRSWQGVFEADGRAYRHAKLVLYRSGIRTGCGSATSAVGPFYCPADQRVYLDLSFERQMTGQLQADCYAGVWAHAAFKAGELDPGDIDEALRAAAAVGDDRLQRQATGTINPDTFTHGTSKQRASWFSTGYRTGEPARCDTFA